MSYLSSENDLVRKLITGLAVSITFGLLAGFVALRAQTETTTDSLTAIYVEPGSLDGSRLAANTTAELASAVAAGDEVLLAAALDGTDATTYTGDFGCGQRANKLQCQRDVDDAHLAALDALDGLLAAPAPAGVDAFASVRGLVQFLSRHQAPDGVTLIMNISGRHDVAPVDLRSAHLGDRIEEVADLALTSGLFPDDTTGVTANIVMPFSGDAAHDAAIEEVFSRLFEATGGRLAYFGQTWTSDGYSAELPPFREQGVTGTRTGAQTTISLNSALFDTDSADLRPESLSVLDEVVTRIADLDDVRSIEITGFADRSGDPAYNLGLTGRRAEAVRGALLARLNLGEVGITQQQVTSRGAGSAPGAGDDDHRYRRVDIVVTARTSA